MGAYIAEMYSWKNNMWGGITGYILDNSTDYPCGATATSTVEKMHATILDYMNAMVGRVFDEKTAETMKKGLKRLERVGGSLGRDNVCRLVYMLMRRTSAVNAVDEATIFLNKYLHTYALSPRSLEEFIWICAINCKMPWDETLALLDEYGEQIDDQNNYANAGNSGMNTDSLMDAAMKLKSADSVRNFLKKHEQDIKRFFAKNRNTYYAVIDEIREMADIRLNRISEDAEPLSVREAYLRLYSLLPAEACYADTQLTEAQIAELCKVFPDVFLSFSTFKKLMLQKRAAEVNSGIYLLAMLISGFVPKGTYKNCDSFTAYFSDAMYGIGYPLLNAAHPFDKLLLDVFDNWDKNGRCRPFNTERVKACDSDDTAMAYAYLSALRDALIQIANSRLKLKQRVTQAILSGQTEKTMLDEIGSDATEEMKNLLKEMREECRQWHYGEIARYPEALVKTYPSLYVYTQPFGNEMYNCNVLMLLLVPSIVKQGDGDESIVLDYACGNSLEEQLNAITEHLKEYPVPELLLNVRQICMPDNIRKQLGDAMVAQLRQLFVNAAEESTAAPFLLAEMYCQCVDKKKAALFDQYLREVRNYARGCGNALETEKACLLRSVKKAGDTFSKKFDAAEYSEQSKLIQMRQTEIPDELEKLTCTADMTSAVKHNALVRLDNHARRMTMENTVTSIEEIDCHIYYYLRTEFSGLKPKDDDKAKEKKKSKSKPTEGWDYLGMRYIVHR